jgi:hypothetical protein
MTLKYLRELRQFKEESQLRSWDVYRSLIGRLCEAHSSFEFTRTILGSIRNQDVRALVELADSLSEAKYSDATQHFVANQFAYLIKKYPFPETLSPYDAEAKGKEKWLLAEAQCLETNKRFSQPVTHLEWQLSKMRSFISYVLSESVDLPLILKRCDFGPGASLGVHGNATNKARKIASSWTVSPKALNYGYAALSHNWHLFEIILDKSSSGIACLDSSKAFTSYLSRVTCVQHNKIAFVPKTVKVHRPIAVEPLLNGFVQKGIDLVMRDKLRRIGIDLSDQSLNQRMAREGSLDDSEDGFVTIDLSSASDSIAIEVVRNVLPYEWYRLLASIRSEHYRDSSDVNHPYHKFCSMGNGFCFPLETLLFAAVCSACDAGKPGLDFMVYGDDIIVRKRYAQAVLQLLSEIGFTVNTGKTFLEGHFRESCGSDWFGGEDVRPYTLDHRLDSLESMFKFLNLSERNRRSKDFFLPVRGFIESLIPPRFRFVRLHDGNPDTGYRVGQDQFLASPFTKWNQSLQCWSWLELVSTPIKDNWRHLQDAAHAHVYAALSGASSTAPFTIRRMTKTNVRRVAYG